VGSDYYIATSTFKWFPGVQIHHSTDLIHWELICHPLEKPSQLNMIGNQSSCGIWAPCLSYSNGIYYLIYTDVKAFIGICCQDLSGLGTYVDFDFYKYKEF